MLAATVHLLIPFIASPIHLIAQRHERLQGGCQSVSKRKQMCYGKRRTAFPCHEKHECVSADTLSGGAGALVMKIVGRQDQSEFGARRAGPRGPCMLPTAKRWIQADLLPAALGDGDDSVDAGDGDVLNFAVGPVDFDVIDFGSLAEAEVG